MSGELQDELKAEGDIDEETLLNDDRKMAPGREQCGNKDETDDDGTKYKRGLYQAIMRFKCDKIFRHKILQTAVLCWSFIGLGWGAGMNGPVFPDLRQIIQEDLATSSWMFTVGSFGSMSGSFVGGILYDKLNKVLLLIAISLGSGICTLFTPYCSTLPWMLFIKFALGFFFGGLDTGGNAYIIHIWGADVDVYMQVLHFAFSTGAMLSPLATEPFLAGVTTVCDKRNIAVFNASAESYSTNENTEYDLLVISSAPPDFKPATSNNSLQLLSCTDRLEKSNVHYAFFIASLFMFSSVIGYIYLYMNIRRNKTKLSRIHSDTKTGDTTDKRSEIPFGVKVAFLTMLSLLIASYCVAEDTLAGFLMTFSLDYLNWDKSTGSFATAVFWFSFCAGRFFGIFIVSCCKNSTLLTTYLLLLSLAYTGFVVATLFRMYPLIWVFIALLGFSMSVIFPAVFSWTSEHVIYVSGKISGLFLTSSCLAVIVSPLLIGYLMEYYHPMWYAYIMLIVAFTSVCLYICIRILRKCCLKKQMFTREVEIKVDMELTQRQK